VAGVLLIGFAGNAIACAWWLDPAVGPLVDAVPVNGGRWGWRRRAAASIRT
jgi:hypothetical protein